MKNLMNQKINNKKESSNIISQNTNTTLYLSPCQENQGVQSSTLKVLYPKELSKAHIKTLLISSGNTNAENETFIDKCSRFLKFLFDKQCRDYNNELYQRLDSKILGKKLGKNKERTPNYYPYLLQILNEVGLLEIKKNFRRTDDGTGECNGYRVKLQYPGIYQESDTDYLFSSDRWVIDNEDYLEQIFQLEFDENKFIFLANLLPYDEKVRAFYLYHNWINRKHYVRIDSYGRVHSLLTILDKRFRSCLKINGGKELLEADIHACQPFLLLKIVQKHLNYYQKEKLNIKQLSEKHPEILKYLTWIKNGRFYIELYKCFYNTTRDPQSAVKLYKFKKMLFKNIFFSDTPDKNKKLKIHHIFSEQFKVINDALVKQKKKEGFKSVSCELQALESKIMNASISKLDKLPKKDFYIRYHDAFLTTESFTHEVKSILFECLEDEMDVPGMVKSGNKWGEDFETVVTNLNLMAFTTKLKHKGDKYVNKLIGSEIKKQVINVANEEKQIAIEGVRNKWRYEPEYNRKKAVIAQNFTFKSFYIPSHWTKPSVLEFKEFAACKVSEVFDIAMIKHEGGVKQLIKYNRDFILDKVNQISV